MIPAVGSAWEKSVRAPRTSGDDPNIVIIEFSVLKCSPHERG